METRKLQRVGGGTFTVSIPKEWALAHDLEAGAEVHLYTHSDGSVVVRGAERDGGHLERVRVDVGADATDPVRATRPLRAAQAAGFQEVRLVHADAFSTDQRRAVRSLAADLIGTEIVVERADELVVRNMLDADDVSVRQSVVQLQFVALSIHRRATEAVRDADGDARDRLADRRREAERLSGMVARHCNRSLTSLEALDSLGVSRAELFEYYETARHLRAVAEAGVRLARVGDRMTTPPADAVADVLGESADAARRVVDDAASAVLDGSAVEPAHAALDRREELREDIDAIAAALVADSTGGSERSSEAAFDDPSRADAVATARALDPIARTADHGARVARVAARAAVREEP